MACFFCHKEDELVDIDYREYTGHDILVSACKNVNECMERQGLFKEPYRNPFKEEEKCQPSVSQ